MTDQGSWRWPGWVSKQAHQLSPSNAMGAIANAHESVIGGEISSELLFAVGAQSALETNKWGQPGKDGRPHGFWNYNFGNIRGTYNGVWTSFEAGETINGQNITLPAGPANKFRAYPDANTGAKDFLGMLSRKWPKAIEAGDAGDLKGFVQALHDGGYFTANPDRYLRAELSVEVYLEQLPKLAVWAKGLKKNARR